MVSFGRRAIAGLGFPKRGEIYLVNFDPTVGSEIRKTRPALILENAVANEFSPITIVAAITSTIEIKQRPTSVIIDESSSGLKVRWTVLLNQVRSIDRSRLIKRLGKLDDATLRKVSSGIILSLGLVDL